ncbi:MAG: DNA replication/repair protein RecF [Candidatus Nanopelagicales bacterium]
MRVERVELFDFRSYPHVEVSFEPGVNVLLGPNGIGKTNVVEAVGYVSTMSSHRVAADLPLVRVESPQAVIRVESIRRDRSSVTEIAIIPGRANRVQISGSPVRARDVVGQLRTVLFAPEDLALVKGDPSDRRRFLDDLLVQRAPRYAAVRGDYERIVRQRTTLLKSMAGRGNRPLDESAASTLEVWDEQLAEVGASLLFGRLSLMAEIDELVASAYGRVAPGKSATIAYYPRWLSADHDGCALPRDRELLRDLLREHISLKRREELARGVTLIGPHRDDLQFEIGGMPAKSHASHGECWSLALSLRLGSFDLMRGLDDGSGDPVLILDDVFAELDQSRREALVTVAASAEQVLVTAAVADDVPPELAATNFSVAPGEVHRG